MVAVGMLLTWAGYSLGLQGWCLWRDYDVTLGQLMSPFHPYSGPWPPAKIPDGQTWPGGVTSPEGGGQGSSAPSPAKVGAAVSSETGWLQRISQYLPGFGFIK